MTFTIFTIEPDPIPEPLNKYSHWDIAYIQKVYNTQNRSKAEISEMLNVKVWELDAVMVLNPYTYHTDRKVIVSEPKHLTHVNQTFL